MSEQDIRQKLAEIDEKRTRARLLERMAEWPMFSPSSVRTDKRRGVFRWFGSSSDAPYAEIEMTRDERSELREWLFEKSARLSTEAEAISAGLDSHPTVYPHLNCPGLVRQH